jgi:hypothetical protein
VEEELPAGPHRGHRVQRLQLEARRPEHRRRPEVVHQQPEVVHQQPEVHRLCRPVRRLEGQLGEAEAAAE